MNRSIARAVVTVEPDGPGRAELCRIVTDAERPTLQRSRQLPGSLPGDDEVLLGRMMGAVAAVVALGVSASGSALRLRGLPDLIAVPVTITDQVPWVRRHLERRLGPDGTDLLFGVMNAATASVTLAPTAAAAEAVMRTMLAAEAWTGRLAWRRHEPELAGRPQPDHTGGPPRDLLAPVDGPAERYANRAGVAGLGAAAVVGLLSRNPGIAGAAALTAMPKPMRAAREAFGCAMSRGLTVGHDALVLRPRALRTLDRVDAVMIDPRALYTDGLTVSRVVDVEASRRSQAWEALRRELARDNLGPGWHELAGISGAGEVGKALISAVRDPFAAAVVTEARRSHLRVMSLDDDGLRSLAKGFDKLHPLADSIDESVAAAVESLKADGATVLLLTTAGIESTHSADVTIGVVRHQCPPPWGADVFVADLRAAWRVLHALAAARSATRRGIRLSVSASAIGALMLIPGVPGRGPESVNAGVAAALWAGFASARKVFRDPLPEPEASHDWHALPVDEVQRLLPRPVERPTPERGWQDVAAVRGLVGTAASTLRLARDFAGEMRANLSDPLTPVLATGAVASALLGSALDAALVGGVLLTNAALSAEQQLHAERVLRRLLAVQDPQARRCVGPLDQARYEKVAAQRLCPGDIIEVHADEVVPADARLIHALNVEVDESSLTGESLPVPKQADPTPGAPLAERTCMLYAGSTLVAGTALAVVTAVGPRTEVRRALAMAPSSSREIGLQRQLSRITKQALPFSIAGGALVGLLSVLRGTPLRQAVNSAVALTVAAVPEGLPLVATLAQLAAARRLTGESVLVRNPHAVEALARLRVVCFDKTGTLSENRLQVKSVRPVDGFTVDQVLDAAASTIFVRPGHRAHHATDDAIARAADGDGPSSDRAEIRRDAYLPFQSGRPFAAAVIGTRLTIKGAPEVLAAALHDDHAPRTRMIGEMAQNMERLLAGPGPAGDTIALASSEPASEDPAEAVSATPRSSEAVPVASSHVKLSTVVGAIVRGRLAATRAWIARHLGRDRGTPTP